MNDLTIYVRTKSGIDTHAGLQIAISESDGTVVIRTDEDTKETVQGDIFGLKNAAKVWLKPDINNTPVREYKKVLYLMNYPRGIYILLENGRKHHTSGRLLRANGY